MKKENLTEAMDQISDRHIQEAIGYQKKKHMGLRRGWAIVAACLCVVICGAVVWQQTGTEPMQNNPSTTTKEGVTIPPAKVMLSEPEGVTTDMLAFVIYQGRCYVEIQQEAASDLVGKHLGTATGLIDEWTPEDGYVDLAGSVAGDFYAVKGYDPKFMVCMDVYDGRMILLVNNNGITLNKGEELFEKQLHLAGSFNQVQYQSRHDWYNGNGNIRNFGESYERTLAKFVKALNQGKFMLTDDIPLKEGQSDIYGSLETCHLYFEKEDGMVVHLRCFEGGYVQYVGVPDVCVKIDQKVFDAVCDAVDEQSEPR